MISVCDKLSISSNYIPRITTVATKFLLRFHDSFAGRLRNQIRTTWLWKIDIWFISSLLLHYTTDIIIIIKWNVLFVEKIIFWWLHRRFKNLRSTTCKHHRKYYGKCDVIYRYLHIELIWCLLMVQYIQNNVIMKWTARFIRFTGWVPLKYGSTTTPSIIAHCQKTPMSSVVFHIAIPQTSNIRRTPSFDLPTVEFSKRVSIISRALY